MLKNSDLWLWAGLGVFGFFAARTCYKQLSAIRAATETSLDEGIDGSENDKSRNDPSLKSLARLALGPNLRTREAAAKVIEGMTLRHETYSLMLDHIAGENKKLRDEALVCLRSICANRRPKHPEPYISTHISITNCLCNLNSEAYEYEIAFREIGRGYRTPPYFDALKILLRLLRFAMNDYGLLAWLEIYPFGGHSTAEDKKKSIQKLMSNKYRKETMYAVMEYAVQIPAVEEGLIRCNLIDSDMRDRCAKLDAIWQDSGITLGDSPIHRNESELPTFETDLDRSRVRQRGISYNALLLQQRRSRRHRREAAVLRQYGRPIEEEDIFMPSVHGIETRSLNVDLSPPQSQPLETGNHITATGTEVVSGLLTPEPESEESTSE